MVIIPRQVVKKLLSSILFPGVEVQYAQSHLWRGQQFGQLIAGEDPRLIGSCGGRDVRVADRGTALATRPGEFFTDLHYLGCQTKLAIHLPFPKMGPASIDGPKEAVRDQPRQSVVTPQVRRARSSPIF